MIIVTSHLIANLRDSTTADINHPNTHPDKGRIPLVVTENGSVLVTLSDCFEWRSDRYDEQKRLAKERGKALDSDMKDRPKRSQGRLAKAQSSDSSDDRQTTQSKNSKHRRAKQERAMSSSDSDSDEPIASSVKPGRKHTAASIDSNITQPFPQRRNYTTSTSDRRPADITPERPTKKVRVRPSQEPQGSARPNPQPISQSSSAIAIIPASGVSIVRAKASSSQLAQAQVAHASSSLTNPLPNWAQAWSGSRSHEEHQPRLGESFDTLPMPRSCLYDQDSLARRRFNLVQAGKGQRHQDGAYNQRRRTHTALREDEDDAGMDWDNGDMHVDHSYDN